MRLLARTSRRVRSTDAGRSVLDFNRSRGKHGSSPPEVSAGAAAAGVSTGTTGVAAAGGEGVGDGVDAGAAVAVAAGAGESGVFGAGRTGRLMVVRAGCAATEPARIHPSS